MTNQLYGTSPLNHAIGTADVLIGEANRASSGDILRRLGFPAPKNNLFECPTCKAHPFSATFADDTGDITKHWRCTSCDAGGSIVGLVALVKDLTDDNAARWILDLPTATDGTEPNHAGEFFTSTNDANAVENEVPAIVGSETRAEIEVMSNGSTRAAVRPRGSDDRPSLHISTDRSEVDASPLIAAQTPLDAAKAALKIGLKPIPTYAIGETIKTKHGPKEATGKEPVGNAWGERVWADASLEKTFGQNEGRNVGLLMGPMGGIIDIEMDRPADMDADTFNRLADEELAELCGGEIPATVGWRSHRGYHRVFLWDDRLSACAEFTKNAFHHGRLEIRLGAGKQIQSVIPPSRHANGERVWLAGCKVIAALPDVAIERIIEAAKPKPKEVKPPVPEPKRSGTSDSGPKHRDDEAKRLLGMARKLAGNIKTANKGDADTGRHPTALVSARAMGGLIAGHGRNDLAQETRSILIEAYRDSKPELLRNNPEFEQCISDGWNDGVANPDTLPDREPPKGKKKSKAEDNAPKPVFEGEAKPYYDDRVYHDPHVIAEHVLKANENPVVVVKGVPYRYDDGIYLPIAESDMTASLTRFTTKFFARHHEAEKFLNDGEYVPIRPVSAGLIRNVRLAVDGICTDSRVTSFPAWRKRQPDDWAANHVVNCKNGLLNPYTNEFMDHTPRWLSVCKSEADWHGIDAPCPRFLRWLNEVMPGDDEEAEKSRETLQMWFGYLLVADRSHHKILNLVGERRTGKGTTLRLIRRLVGEKNVCQTSLTEISSAFGLQPLLNKTVAMIGDSRPGKANADLSTGAERLLALSGGDCLAVNIKNKDILPDVDLPARVVIASNGNFNMPDPNGVLPTRLVTLRFDQSFAGRENSRIEAELIEELPGILAWAVRGLQKLTELGGFHDLESTRKACEISQEIAQPLIAFTNAVFTGERGDGVDFNEAFHAYVGWLARYKPGAKPINKGQFQNEIESCGTGAKVNRPKPAGGGPRPFRLTGVTPNDSFDGYRQDGIAIIERQIGITSRGFGDRF